MILKRLKRIVALIVLTSLFACNYNSNVMMKTGKDFVFDTPPSGEISEYVISVSDIIDFKLYTNDGSAIIDFSALSSESNANFKTANVPFLVELDGQIKLPIIGRVNLQGKTIKEVEALLEEEYSKFYIKPFVQVKVTNKRVTVFPGGSSRAKIVPLINDNMNLLEALGAVGGLSELAKADRIKLVRGDLKDPKVYLFDLSKFEGIKQIDFVLQANDIIYIEPRTEIMQKVIQDIFPIISLITTTITLVLLINNISNTN